MAHITADNSIMSLNRLLDKVYRYGKYDFRDYKHGTVIRRLARRLHSLRLDTYPQYMQFLDTHPEEYCKLAEDITIKVSSFLRSPYSFQQLSRLVFPELIRSKEARQERKITFWSIACARGEEPYSIAMALKDFLGTRFHNFDIVIRATDICTSALEAARRGEYPVESLASIPESMRNRYFTPSDKGFTISQDIRRIVNFTRLDLTANIPLDFQEIDCIFCCNILIYWQRHLQERVLDKLYKSLANPGYLITGEAETPTSNISEKLVCLDNRAKIYEKQLDYKI